MTGSTTSASVPRTSTNWTTSVMPRLPGCSTMPERPGFERWRVKNPRTVVSVWPALLTGIEGRQGTPLPVVERPAASDGR